MLAAHRHSNCYGRNPHCDRATLRFTITHRDERLLPDKHQHAAGESTDRYRVSANRNAATTYRDARTTHCDGKYSAYGNRPSTGRNYSTGSISLSDRNKTYGSKKESTTEN